MNAREARLHNQCSNKLASSLHTVAVPDWFNLHRSLSCSIIGNRSLIRLDQGMK